MQRDRIVPLDIDLVCYREPTTTTPGEESGENSSKRIKLDDQQSSGENCDEILDCIVPPREWEDANGVEWVQKVSNQPFARTDVMVLTERFEESLRQYRVRKTGICPTRRALYSQCFDEIIRQVTAHCPERGLLLLQCRDEHDMTVDAYRTLYESNVRFGLSEPLCGAERRVTELRNKIAELEEERRRIEGDLAASAEKYGMARAEEHDRRVAGQRRHDEKTEFSRTNDRQLKLFLEGLKELKL